jgi:hypothetical protein
MQYWSILSIVIQSLALEHQKNNKDSNNESEKTCIFELLLFVWSQLN